MKKIVFPILMIATVVTSCSEKKEDVKEENKVEEVAVKEVETVSAPELPSGWELTENEEIKYAGIQDSVTGEQMAELSAKFGQMYGEIGAYLEAKKIEMTGAPLSHWSVWDTNGTSVFDAGIPIGVDIKGNEHVVMMTIPAGKAVKYTYMGGYDDMAAPYTSINEYFEKGGAQQAGGPWEVYLTDPMAEPDTSKWITEIWFPISE